MAPYPECHCLSAEERENHGDATGSPPRLRVCRLYLRSRISVRVPERARHRTHSRRDGGVALGREAPAARSEQTVRGLGSVTVWTGDSDRVASSPLTVRGGLRWQSRGEEDGVLQDTGSGGRKQQEAAGSQPLWVPQPAGDGQTQQRSRLRDSVRLPSSWPGPDVGAPRAGDGRTCFRQWGWGQRRVGKGDVDPEPPEGPALHEGGTGTLRSGLLPGRFWALSTAPPPCWEGGCGACAGRRRPRGRDPPLLREPREFPAVLAGDREPQPSPAVSRTGGRPAALRPRPPQGAAPGDRSDRPGRRRSGGGRAAGGGSPARPSAVSQGPSRVRWHTPRCRGRGDVDAVQAGCTRGHRAPGRTPRGRVQAW